jgi:hypothetical protein
VLQVQRPLVRLLQTLADAADVVTDGDPMPAFDVHCSTMSLPLICGTTLADIPSAPSYLSADPQAAAMWGRRLEAVGKPGPRIGLLWAGNPRADLPMMSAPERLKALFDVPGLHFVSLQKDGPRCDGPLTDFMAEMTDFADTAALIANLDLVVSVDSAVLHVASALGKPVWMLNRFDSCWRWFTGRRDSPWYPRLRIYRQPKAWDWDPVVAHVAHDLRQVKEALPI